MALYLRVLEALLRAEEVRTERAAFPALLASASFHRCLLACAFELVVAAYCMVRPPPRPQPLHGCRPPPCPQPLSIQGSAAKTDLQAVHT